LINLGETLVGGLRAETYLVAGFRLSSSASSISGPMSDEMMQADALADWAWAEPDLSLEDLGLDEMDFDLSSLAPRSPEAGPESHDFEWECREVLAPESIDAPTTCYAPAPRYQPIKYASPVPPKPLAASPQPPTPPVPVPPPPLLPLPSRQPKPPAQQPRKNAKATGRLSPLVWLDDFVLFMEHGLGSGSFAKVQSPSSKLCALQPRPSLSQPPPASHLRATDPAVPIAAQVVLAAHAPSGAPRESAHTERVFCLSLWMMPQAKL